MAKFKPAGETGVTVHYPEGWIRLDADTEYETTDAREVEVLKGASGVVEVKSTAKKTSKKD